jgi:hypothetical protein
MGRPRTRYTPIGGSDMPTTPKPLEQNYTHCRFKLQCDGVELEPTRQKFGGCKACMVEVTARGIKAIAEKPRPLTQTEASRARGAAASARVNTGKRKRMNPTYVINEKGAARSRDFFEAEKKRTKPKRMREPKVESGLQVIGVKFIGKRPGKKRAA